MIKLMQLCSFSLTTLPGKLRDPLNFIYYSTIIDNRDIELPVQRALRRDSLFKVYVLIMVFCVFKTIT
jgi:hypothetical protein